jgi:hypothetical protein
MLRDVFDFLYVGLYTGMMDLIFFFQFQPLTLDLLEMELHNFFSFFFMNLS